MERYEAIVSDHQQYSKAVMDTQEWLDATHNTVLLWGDMDLERISLHTNLERLKVMGIFISFKIHCRWNGNSYNCDRNDEVCMLSIRTCSWACRRKSRGFIRSDHLVRRLYQVLWSQGKLISDHRLILHNKSGKDWSQQSGESHLFIALQPGTYSCQQHNC